MKKMIFLGILPMLFCVAHAQTMTNPDISFIVDSRVNATQDSPFHEDDVRLTFEEIEIAGSGYLNPFARADVFLGIHGTEGEVEIEEAFATILRGMPLNMQLKVGQYLVDFGKLNTQHPHQWSWMTRPVMHERFLGEDGLRDVGVSLSSLIPVGTNSLTVSANLLQGDFFEGHHHGEAETTEVAEDTPDLAASGRISFFSQLTSVSSIEVGISGLRGEHDPTEKCWATMGNFDLKYRWRPNMYTSLNLMVEALLNSRTVDSELDESGVDIKSYGAFAVLGYQFRRRFDVGLFYDYGQSPDSEEDEQTGCGAFAGFSMAEETYRIGLMARNDDASDYENSYQTFALQFLWSLGPHKPHAF